jgi:hypothetical protein
VKGLGSGVWTCTDRPGATRKGMRMPPGITEGREWGFGLQGRFTAQSLYLYLIIYPCSSLQAPMLHPLTLPTCQCPCAQCTPCTPCMPAQAFAKAPCTCAPKAPKAPVHAFARLKPISPRPSLGDTRSRKHGEDEDKAPHLKLNGATPKPFMVRVGRAWLGREGKQAFAFGRSGHAALRLRGLREREKRVKRFKRSWRGLSV